MSQLSFYFFTKLIYDQLKFYFLYYDLTIGINGSNEIRPILFNIYCVWIPNGSVSAWELVYTR